tara:strand:- start:211 stop:465 length:255 start_codon:yes stop_codon:yes gene_type:complete
MSKHYMCDHCDSEIHFSKKLSITANEGFNILMGDSSKDKEYIHRKNFYRLDFCNINCMVQSLSQSKYKAVKLFPNLKEHPEANK